MEDARSLPAIAITALSEGIDSPSMRVLAGLTGNEDPGDAENLFKEALSEIGMLLPTKRDAMMFLAANISSQIVDGSIDPYDGAKEIWDLTLRNHDIQISELDTFVYGASEWEERPEDRGLFIEGIIAAAESLQLGG